MLGFAYPKPCPSVPAEVSICGFKNLQQCLDNSFHMEIGNWAGSDGTPMQHRVISAVVTIGYTGLIRGTDKPATRHVQPGERCFASHTLWAGNCGGSRHQESIGRKSTMLGPNVGMRYILHISIFSHQ